MDTESPPTSYLQANLSFLLPSAKTPASATHNKVADPQPRLWGVAPEVLRLWGQPPVEWQKTFAELARALALNLNLNLIKNGHSYHSRRDSRQEALRVLKAWHRQGKQYALMVGAGLGHIPFLGLEKPLDFGETAGPEEQRQKGVASTKKQEGHTKVADTTVTGMGGLKAVFLIEPDAEVLFYMLSLYDWRHKAISILHSEQILASEYPHPSPPNKQHQQQEQGLDKALLFMRGKQSSALQLYFHRPALYAYPALYASYQSRLPQLIRTRHVNQNTLIKFQEVWNRNIFLNLPQIASSHSLQELLRLLSKLQAEQQEHPPLSFVVAGAGPSLNTVIPILKKERSKFILLAVDTAFIPLAAQGVYADIALSVDPQWVNHHFLTHKDIGRSLWLLDPAVCYINSQLLAKAKAHVFWWDNPFYLDQVLRAICGNRGVIAHGGSVSTNAFDLALQAQAEEIILVGQDLAYPTSAAHCKGSVLEAAVFYNNRRFGGMEAHSYKQLRSFAPRYVPAVPTNLTSTVKDRYTDNDAPQNPSVKPIHPAQNTPTVLTSEKMQVFIAWFQERAALELQTRRSTGRPLKLLNASSQGAKLEGFADIDVLTLRQHLATKACIVFSPKTETSSHSRPQTTACFAAYAHSHLCETSCMQDSSKEAKLHQTLRELRDQSRELMRAYQENHLLSQNLAERGAEKNLVAALPLPTQEQMRILESNDALNSRYVRSAKIISLGAQKSIIAITEGDSQNPYANGALFYHELRKSAFAVTSYADKALGQLGN